MAKVVHLENDQSPPDSEDRVLVTELPSGKYEIAIVMQVDDFAASFLHSSPLDQPLDVVVHVAAQIADRAKAATVYVRTSHAHGT